MAYDATYRGRTLGLGGSGLTEAQADRLGLLLRKTAPLTPAERGELRALGRHATGADRERVREWLDR